MEQQIDFEAVLTKVLLRFASTDEKILNVLDKVDRMDFRLTKAIDRIDTRLSDHERVTAQRFTRLETKIDDLDKRVEEKLVDLTNSIDEMELKMDLISTEQKAIREEQKFINTKMDERVTNLETWRNTYQH